MWPARKRRVGRCHEGEDGRKRGGGDAGNDNGRGATGDEDAAETSDGDGDAEARAAARVLAKVTRTCVVCRGRGRVVVRTRGTQTWHAGRCPACAGRGWRPR